MDTTLTTGHHLPMAKHPRTRKEQAQEAHAKRPVYQRIYLREWLEVVGKRQRDVVDALGISESHLSLIGSGRRQYTQENLEAIAKFLAIEPSMLLHPPAEPPLALIIQEMSQDERRQAAIMLDALRRAR